MSSPMLRATRLLILAGLLTPLIGCDVPPVAKSLYSPCRVISSANWTARVEGYLTRHGHPEHRRNLVVEGDVTVPSQGYSLTLEPGATQRIEPHFRQMHLNAQPGPDSAAQMVSTRHVVARIPYDKKIQGFAIRCGDGIIAEIPEIAPEPSA
ncbi:hypothetical protein [Sphingosinicella sp. BN140058]|uniref:hypothetical protein n=1 Tax=Sphingosinicella sp. BN140058 TaxID=1892855 RepID=UPI001011C344|nr:hypothetical protein [Sphingosinicella sp. BN140058]QAY77725.1 hypothetical protein ETR14_15280 [Sphingosinicella sp. BN140058]